MIAKENLEEMYWGDGMNLQEIGELCGISNVTVWNWMRDYGIKTRTISEAKLGRQYQTHLPKPSKKDLEEMYWVKSMSTPEIGELCGVSGRTVYDWMRDYGIEIRTKSEAKLVNSAKPPKEDLEKMYLVDGMNPREIGELYNVGHSAVRYWLIDYDIKTRTHSDFTGEKASGWKGGISGGKYCYKFNNIFKEAVRKRDDYTCQLCQFEQKLNGRKLSVHHIHYLKEDCYPDVVALCRSCNSRVNANRDYWENYFENQLIERELLYWSLS